MLNEGKGTKRCKWWVASYHRSTSSSLLSVSRLSRYARAEKECPNSAWKNRSTVYSILNACRLSWRYRWYNSLAYSIRRIVIYTHWRAVMASTDLIYKKTNSTNIKNKKRRKNSYMFLLNVGMKILADYQKFRTLVIWVICINDRDEPLFNAWPFKIKNISKTKYI